MRGWDVSKHPSAGEGGAGAGAFEGSEHILAAFNSTLAAMAKAGDSEGTCRVVAMLQEAGLHPNASTFNSMMRGTGERGAAVTHAWHSGYTCMY